MPSPHTPTPECEACRAALPFPAGNTLRPMLCPVCGGQLWLNVFPAFWRHTPDAPESLNGVVPQAACFFHADNTATEVCAHCGRLLCALCTIRFDGHRLCPLCVRRNPRAAGADRVRYLYDEMALACALVSWLMFPLAIITAPATMYVAVRYWRMPTSVVRRSHWRMGVAVAFALIILVAWGLWFTFLVAKR